MLMNTDKIKKWTFRVLVLGIFLSLAYDLFFFIMIQDYGGDQSDGGVEKGIRSFSLTVSYFSFFFRVTLPTLTNLDHRGSRFLERFS